MSWPEETELDREAELAASTGDAAQLRECLNKGARLGFSIYYAAVRSGDIDTFKTILDCGGSIDACLEYQGSP